MTEQKPRGRPRSFDKTQVLDLILNEFWTKGFASTSLDDLSAATGLSRPSLYAAYGDKSAMYGAALEAFAGRLRTRALPALQDEPDLSRALSGFFSGALDVYFEDKPKGRGCLAFSTAIADAPLDPVVQLFLQRFLDSLDQALLGCLERFHPDVSMRERQIVAQIAGGMLTNLATRARSGATRSELDVLAQASAKLISSALQPNEWT